MATSEPQKYVTNKVPVFRYSKNVISMDSIPYSTTNTGIPLSPSLVYSDHDHTALAYSILDGSYHF